MSSNRKRRWSYKHTLTWMLTIQGFLFASIAIIGHGSDVSADMYNILKYTIPATGVILSILSYKGIRGAELALKNLKSKWTIELDENFLKPFGDDIASKHGGAPSRYLPVLFIFLWSMIFLFILYAEIKCK